MQLRPASQYIKELRPFLGPDVFKPARSRLIWLPVHMAIIATLTIAIARGWLPWPLIPVASLLLGISFAGMTFVGHEAGHGGVVRGRRLKYVATWLGFLPFVHSPRLWMVWHNREHHGHTNQGPADPDMYPSLSVYQGSSLVRTVTDKFSLGGGRLSGVLSLLFGFTGQSTKILTGAHRRGWLSKGAHRAAIAETLLGVAIWATVAFFVGPLFVFTFVLPLIVANWMVMAYILTNHGLSPATDVNDPLVNSLSVTVSPLYNWLTLGFGFHTEHHLYPAMSTRHAPKVRDQLVRLWPERYQSMPLTTALLRLHRTARVYRDAVTLTDPRTGAVWSTLLPGEPAERRADAQGSALPAGGGDSTWKPASHGPRTQATPI